MRILKILNSQDDGGVLTCETQFIEEITKRDGIVDAVILGDGPSKNRYKEIVNDILEIPQLNTRFSGGGGAILKSIYRALKFGLVHRKPTEKFFKGRGYDAIIYRRVNMLFLAGFIAKKLKANTFWHMPNIVSGKSSYIFYNIAFRILKIKPIANSIFTQNTIGSICKHVVYPGFDNKRVENDGTPVYRIKLGIDANTPIYGIAARVTHDKAQDLVVEAFAKSEVANRGGHLLIAGGLDDIEFVEVVKERAGRLFGEQIHLLDKISDLGGFYSSIDVMINGRRNAEPFGISIAESLGAGVPVIAYYLGGPSEMIENSRTGWLVNNVSAEDYLNKINISFLDRQRWKEMGRDCREDAKKFQVDHNVTVLMSIIEHYKKTQNKQ